MFLMVIIITFLPMELWNKEVMNLSTVLDSGKLNLQMALRKKLTGKMENSNDLTRSNH